MYRSARYDGEPGSVGDARRLATEFLDRLAEDFHVLVPERFGYDVLLVVTELLTNAERCAIGPSVLELEAGVGSVVVTVWDGSTALPVVYAPDPVRVGGHGMEIVSGVCAQVTTERMPEGKRIRAVLLFPDGG
ncbi:ATP-binding protein [Streptomyces fildesensis]|uniref:ATP-binding protein n=1 Tax=Streptomyces fildesensis TaxID=375757 RepID=A0ABW8CA44_9ACTN